VPAGSTNLFKFHYEDEALNDKQLIFGVQNMMHNTRVNEHYIRGKFNSLHSPFEANKTVPRIILWHLILDELYSTVHSLLEISVP
jgi:hypothetical protein